MAAAAALRAGMLLGLWLALAGTAAKDLPVGLVAAALGAWASLRLMPPGTARPRIGALLVLLLRFPWQALSAGFAVARLAVDRRHAPAPRCFAWTPRLPRGRARDAFLAYASLLPGTLPAGETADGDVLLHALDGATDPRAAMTAEEARFARAFGLDG